MQKKPKCFYGEDKANMAPVNPAYSALHNPRELFHVLERCWSEDTCAPRMRQQWNENNKTLGQCSITAFLVQDIFGGDVLGVPLGDGNYHCFNVVDGVAFDLTSAQFGDVALDYGSALPQSREVHFAKQEKKERYLLLKEKLNRLLL